MKRIRISLGGIVIFVLWAMRIRMLLERMLVCRTVVKMVGCIVRYSSVL